MRRPTEILRRLYRDFVVGRSSMKLVQAESLGDNKHPPVFIIGVYRSGTTMLRYMMDSHSRFCCPPESDFVLPVTELLDDQRAIQSLNDMGFDEAHVLSKLRETISYFFLNYAKSVQKERWVDKTPSYINCLDKIKKVFPDAKFLMIYRHGLDQAHSMTRGGTYMRPVLEEFCEGQQDLRLGATRYWAKQVNKMMDFEKQHPEDCFRLHYESLCDQPEPILKQMFDFLGEAFEPEILNYGDFQHTIGKEDGRALSTKSVQTASHHFDKWKVALRDECFRIGRDALHSLDYKQDDEGPVAHD